MQKAAEEALSDIFFVGFEELNIGFQNALYFFIEGVLTETASKRSLDDMFRRNLEGWTQSSLFIEAVTQRSLNSPHFVRPVAKSIRKNLKDQVEIYQTDRENDRKYLDTAGIPVIFVEKVGRRKIQQTYAAPPS